MKLKNYALIPLLCFLRGPAAGCGQVQVTIEDISRPPQETSGDKKYADVFKPWDGIWEGKFFVYVDERGQSETAAQPKNLSREHFETLPLKQQLVLEVRQEYRSESPYFQRVKIIDKYLTEAGEEKVLESRGVNKIQDGKMWCVVVKPDETVIHSGTRGDEHTIIWQRELHEPIKIEYFKETVSDSTYSILGWGYYGNDKPHLSPRYWFRGEYKRIDH